MAIASESLGATPPKRQWWRWAVVLLIGVVGIDLALRRPLWLAPPKFASTPLIYWVVAFLWIPAGFILRPDSFFKRRWLSRLLVIALTLGAIATLFVPNAFVVFTDGAFGHKCVSEALAGGQIRYNCTLNDFSADTFEFIGPQNGLFVELVRSGSAR